jgi:hypothetical protein
MPFWKRALIRDSILFGVPTLLWIAYQIHEFWLFIWSPEGQDTLFKLEVGSWLFAQLLLGVLIWFVPWKWKRWSFHRRYVNPTAIALVGLLHEQPKINVPIDIHNNDDAKATIELPPRMTPEEKTQTLVETAIGAKLAGEFTYRWKWVGPNPTLAITPAPLPPSSVTYADIQKAMLDVPPFTSVLGLASRRVPVTWDIGKKNSTAVHMLVSAATGGGKSTLAKLVIAKWLADGGIVIICDFKKVSHLWAAGLPGVVYCRAIEDIHRAQIAVADECERRFEIILQENDEDAIIRLGMPPVLIVNEEFNVTMAKLRSYWAKQPESKKVKASPGVQAWSDILMTGRQARIHALAITQMGTVRAVGGSEIREQFTDRNLMNYSPNAAKMLCPDVVLPPSSRAVGSAVLYRSDGWSRYQIAHMSKQEAIDYALAGQKRLGLHWPNYVSIGQALQDTAPAQLEYTNYPAIEAAVNDTDDTEELVSLRQAVDSGILDMTLDAARKATQRKEFPDPHGKNGAGNLYNPGELRTWQRNRPRAAV